jgi:hypothetical protein
VPAVVAPAGPPFLARVVATVVPRIGALGAGAAATGRADRAVLVGPDRLRPFAVDDAVDADPPAVTADRADAPVGRDQRAAPRPVVVTLVPPGVERIAVIVTGGRPVVPARLERLAAVVPARMERLAAAIPARMERFGAVVPVGVEGIAAVVPGRVERFAAIVPVGVERVATVGRPGAGPRAAAGVGRGATVPAVVVGVPVVVVRVPPGRRVRVGAAGCADPLQTVVEAVDRQLVVVVELAQHRRRAEPGHLRRVRLVVVVGVEVVEVVLDRCAAPLAAPPRHRQRRALVLRVVEVGAQLGAVEVDDAGVGGRPGDVGGHELGVVEPAGAGRVEPVRGGLLASRAGAPLAAGGQFVDRRGTVEVDGG